MSDEGADSPKSGHDRHVASRRPPEPGSRLGKQLAVVTVLGIGAFGVWLGLRERPPAARPAKPAPARVVFIDAGSNEEEPEAPPDADYLPEAAAPDAAPTGTKLKDRLEANRLLSEAKGKKGDDRSDLLELALKHDPLNEEVLLLLTRDALEISDFESARKMAARCLEVRPSNEECSKLQRWAHSRDGKFSEALTLYDKCLDGDPKSGSCADGKAMSLIGLRRFDDAQKAIDAHPAPGPWTTFNRGLLAQRGGKFDEALKHYDAACKSKQVGPACRRAEEVRARGDAGAKKK